jgi:hypothetical protein
MTYLKAHEKIRCIRSERSKKLVEITTDGGKVEINELENSL